MAGGQQAAGKAGRQAYGQAGRWAGTRVCVGQVGIQVGRQASFEPAEGRLQKLVRLNWAYFNANIHF